MSADDLDDIRAGLAADPRQYPPDYTRLLTVKCARHGDWLTRVYVRNRRPYAIFVHTFTTTLGDDVDEHGNIVKGRTFTTRAKASTRTNWGVRYIDTAAPDVVMDCNNDCCAASIPVGWLREQLDRGRTSAKYPPKK